MKIMPDEQAIAHHTGLSARDFNEQLYKWVSEHKDEYDSDFGRDWTDSFLSCLEEELNKPITIQ